MYPTLCSCAPLPVTVLAEGCCFFLSQLCKINVCIITTTMQNKFIGGEILPNICGKLFKARASQVALVVKNQPANAGDTREVVQSLVGKIPWRRKCVLA